MYMWGGESAGCLDQYYIHQVKNDPVGLVGEVGIEAILFKFFDFRLAAEN